MAEIGGERREVHNLWMRSMATGPFVDRNCDLQELLPRLAEPIRGTQYFLPLSDEAGAATA